MIKELVVRDPKKTPLPHWHKVPWLKSLDKVTFKPGLNVIFGKNGSGKSTLINGLAILMHCRDENWPRISKTSITRFMRASTLADGLLLKHDGAPCRYLGIDPPGWAPEKGIVENKLMLEAAEAARGMQYMSAGQGSMTKLVRFLKAEPEKVKLAFGLKDATGDWGTIYRVATESIMNVEKSKAKKKRQSVILLDEVDSHLDFAKQHAMWTQLKEMAQTHQIIVASHSPFAVSVPGANYIEATPGYLDGARAALASLLESKS